MAEHRVKISPKELLDLVEWISKSFDTPPKSITLIALPTGIGTAIRAEVETAEGEGRYKDITDYDNW